MVHLAKTPLTSSASLTSADRLLPAFLRAKLFALPGKHVFECVRSCCGLEILNAPADCMAWCSRGQRSCTASSIAASLNSGLSISQQLSNYDLQHNFL